MNKLIIPERIKVGFQERKDTYCGKLAYVIYFDNKGVLRKEASWNSWRDKKIEPVEFDNTPRDGFVLNKKVGGYKSHWNYRDAHVRVYDSRDFEFEISVPNLLFILTQTDCSRGKGLEGKFVYAWQGTELVLLPVECEEYRLSAGFTKLQSQSVKSKELIPGATYLHKDTYELIYLGRFDVFRFPWDYQWNRPNTPNPERSYVFWNHAYNNNMGGFEFHRDLKKIAGLKSDVIHPDYASLVDGFYKSQWGSKPVELVVREVEGQPKYWVNEAIQDGYQIWSHEYDSKTGRAKVTYKHYAVTLRDGELKRGNRGYYYSEKSEPTYPPAVVEVMKQEEVNRTYSYRYGCRQSSATVYREYVPPTNKVLYVRFESGSEIPFIKESE